MLRRSFSCSGPLFSSFVCSFSIYSALLHISLIPSLLHTTARACSSTDQPWLAPSFELLEVAVVVTVKLKLKTFETVPCSWFVPLCCFFVFFSQLHFNPVNSALYFHSCCFSPHERRTNPGWIYLSTALWGTPSSRFTSLSISPPGFEHMEIIVFLIKWQA